MIQLVRKPRTFTSAELLIEEVRNAIFAEKTGYQVIADKCSVSRTTIQNLATGKTRWPRPTTLFPLLQSLGLEMRITKKGEES